MEFEKQEWMLVQWRARVARTCLQQQERWSLLPGWMRELFKDGGFPVKGVDHDPKGNEEARWEAVKVEKKSLDDTLFLPPVDYKKQDMAVIRPQSGDGMKKGRSTGER